MSVQVYGCNHVAIEVGDIEEAVTFYKDVFNLEQMRGGEGDAFFKLGEHQFLAIFEVEKVQPANLRHFGIMVRDEAQLAEVQKKLKEKYELKLEPPFRCDFHDPWGNRIQVVDLHDESLVWLLPYGEVQKAGIKFDTKKSMQLVLKSCTIRPWRLDDAESLARHANNRKVWIALCDVFPHPYTVEDAHEFLQRAISEQPTTKFCIEADGAGAGGISIRPGQDVHRHTAGLGYWLAE